MRNNRPVIRKRKLPVYQYRLPLRVLPPEPKPIPVVRPHLVWYDNQWHLYRSPWKSQFRGPKLWAAAISGSTIQELQARLRKAHDGWKYGYHHPVRTARRAARGGW